MRATPASADARTVDGMPVTSRLDDEELMASVGRIKELLAEVPGMQLPRDLFSPLKSAGVKAGAALNPSTPAETVDYVLDELDLVLVMSVNPGFGGQSFIDSQLRKIETLRTLIDARGLETIIEVDGGVNPVTAAQCINAGASALADGGITCKCKVERVP